MKNIDEKEFWNKVSEEEILMNHELKAKKEILKDKVNELVSEGIEKSLAKVMAKAYLDCNL